jgi:membrane-bound serine protease (ClpP class)
MDPSYATIGFVLIGVGVLFLVGEFFLPSGFLLILALAVVIVGVALTFAAGATTGLLTLFGTAVALPAVSGLMLRLWPKPLARRNRAPELDTVAAMPVVQELEKLRGRFGRTLSALRPAGVVDFDGRRIDALTEGMLIEPGRLVRCLDVRAGKVVVRLAEKPDVGGLENASFE